MGLFKRLLGKDDEVDPILGGLSEPSGLEARPAESGFSAAPAPAPAAEPLDLSSPMDLLKLARQFQQQPMGDPETAARWMQQFYAAQGIDTGGEEDDEIAQLERLAALHQRGALSDDEFAAAKAKLLGGA
jgi:hypothetical protein